MYYCLANTTEKIFVHSNWPPVMAAQAGRCQVMCAMICHRKVHAMFGLLMKASKNAHQKMLEHVKAESVEQHRSNAATQQRSNNRTETSSEARSSDR
jgi:hypothetical protein